MNVALPKVLLDENVPAALAALLVNEGVAVVTAASAGVGRSDDDLLAWASREQWVLVTGDLDFPRLIFSDRCVPPLLLIVERRQPCNPVRLATDLLRVLRVGPRLHGHVVVFDGDDERVRPFPK